LTNRHDSVKTLFEYQMMRQVN